MELVANMDGTWSMQKLHDMEKLLLEKIREAADYSDSEKAKERIFPTPVRDDGKPDEDADAIRGDWGELVRPELASLFEDALGVVEDDLKKMKKSRAGKKGERYEISVPKAHANQWCQALNQARLVLHEKHALPEQNEMLDGEIPEGKWMAMLQSEIYGVIMEFLVTRVLWIK
ncbi:MAG: DUF2017 family protein [Verrucomicrobiota bacterium]